MNSKNPSILYIFGFGRSKLINSEKVYPNDFFYGYFDVNGEVTSPGSVLAKFISVSGEAELAELQLMKAKEEDVGFAKAA